MQHPDRITLNEKTTTSKVLPVFETHPKNLIQTVSLLHQPTNSSSSSPNIGQSGAVTPLYSANTHGLFVLSRTEPYKRSCGTRCLCGFICLPQKAGRCTKLRRQQPQWFDKRQKWQKERNRISGPCFAARCKPGLLYLWLPRTTVRPLHNIIAIGLGNSTRLPLNPASALVAYNRKTIQRSV